MGTAGHYSHQRHTHTCVVIINVKGDKGLWIILNLDDMTALEDNRVFRLEQQPNYSYEKDTFTQKDISIEMNLS